jgi:4-methyl-5(b-hydroxyethyl)-thiazole monophosphate biosynthesis
MKKQVVVLLAPGFEEIEAITVVNILRRAGIHVVIAGTVEGPITAARGVRILADISIDQAIENEFDMVVLPGGSEGAENLGKDTRVKRVLEKAIQREKFVAAICAAPSLLTGFLAGRKATSHPCVKSVMQGVTYTEERVCVDGRFITSRSPGTAMEFAFELVSQLCGAERVRAVNEGVMARL